MGIDCTTKYNNRQMPCTISENKSTEYTSFLLKNIVYVMKETVVYFRNKKIWDFAVFLKRKEVKQSMLCFSTVKQTNYSDKRKLFVRV